MSQRKSANRTVKAVPGRKRNADVVGYVHRIIQEKAIRYELRPGEHVNELALARELKVSRTPIREALNRLVSEGLMSVVPNKGFYAQSLDIDGIRHLFEVRFGLESMAVRLGCLRASDTAIAELTAHWSGIKKRRKDLSIEDITGEDEAFHIRLAALSNNPELLRMIRDINARIRFVRRVALEFAHYRKITFSEHDAILDAVRRRDPGEAAGLLSEHISTTLDDIERIVKESIARIYLTPRPRGRVSGRGFPAIDST